VLVLYSLSGLTSPILPHVSETETPILLGTFCPSQSDWIGDEDEKLLIRLNKRHLVKQD
jgi:hypothetical protein